MVRNLRNGRFCNDKLCVLVDIFFCMKLLIRDIFNFRYM